MFNSPEKRNYHNPKVALAAAGEVSAGLGEMRQKLQGALNDTAEAAQRHGQFPDAKGVSLQRRGDELTLEDRIEARDLLNKDVLERNGVPAHVGEEALKGAEVVPNGAEVVPINPAPTVEQPQEKAA